MVTIEYTQIPRQNEEIRWPFGQQYPVVVQSMRFGGVHRYVLYAELMFQVDFAAAGPPHSWTKMAAMNPYQIARMRYDDRGSGYLKEEWQAFCSLVQETESAWSTAKYSTNIRFLLNHRYESSTGMNTHER